MMMKRKRFLLLIFLAVALAFVMVARTIPSAHAMTATFTAEGASGAGFDIYDNTLHEGYNNPSGTASMVVNLGDSLTITATKPPNTYSFSEWYWAGDPSPPASYSNPYTFTFTDIPSSTMVAVFNVAITVNSAYGDVNPNGVVNQGGSDAPYVSSPVSLASGEQAVCTGYSTTSYGSGYGTSVSLSNIQTDQTVTFNWQVQYYLTVSSGSVGDGTSGSGWYNAGTYAYASTNDQTISTGSGAQVVFASWSYDGGTNNGYDQVLMTRAITDTATWTQQYYLTVTGGDGAATGQGWYNTGSDATASSDYVWNVVSGQSRSSLTEYNLDSGAWNAVTRADSGSFTTPQIPMDAPHTISFNGVTQYFLSVTGGSSISYGTASPTGDNWYDSGSSTTVSSSGVYGRAGGSGARVSAWNLDGGSNTAESTTGTATTSPISMGTYHTVTFNSVTQYQVTLDSGATAALSSITSPTISRDNYWYDSGTTVTISLNGVWGRSSGSGTRLSNYALNGGSNIPTYTTSAFNVFSGPISSHEYVTTTTVTQYFLTVTGGNAVSYGTASTISGDTGWYDTGTSTTVSSNWVWTIVAGQSRDAINNYAVNSVNQNPTRQYSGTLTTGSLSMTAAQTVAFSAVVQYNFSATSTYGSPTGAGWYDTGNSVSSTVTTPVAGAAGVQYVTSGYTGTGSLMSGGVQGTSTTGLFSITAASTCVWNWLTQYEITPSSDSHSTITPSTAQWVNSGGSESFTYSPGSGYTINLVLVNGTSVPITGSFTFTHVSAPQTIAVSTTSNTFTITATADAHSTISPSGAFSIAAGGSQAFSFSPSTGYHISAVTVNGTSESTTSPYTFTNVEANYVISVSTTAYATLNLQTIDEQGNVLSGTTITLNGTAYQTTVGVLQLTNLLTGTDYAGSVTWQNVDVNASFNIELLTQNTALNIVCTAYPYQFNNVLYEVATNRPVTSEIWDGTHFTIFFGASLTSNALVFDAPQVPTYLSGLSYSLASDWNPSTDVFTYTLSNSTFQAAINFDNFGSGFYLQEVDTPISTVSWTGQTFTINLETNGTGNLIIHCSTRGVPTTVTGMTAVYDSITNFLTGTYTDNDQIIVDWTQTTTPPGGGGTGGGTTSNVDVAVSAANFGDVTLGENQTIDVSFTFTGTSLTVTGIQLTGNNSQYFKVDTKFPQTFFGGSGTITLELDLPLDATLGTFTSTLTLSATDAFGTTHTASSSVAYTAQNPGPGTTIQIPNNSTTEFAVALAVMIVVIVGSLAVLTRRRT